MGASFTAYEATDGVHTVRSEHATVLARFYGQVRAIFTLHPEPVPA